MEASLPPDAPDPRPSPEPADARAPRPAAASGPAFDPARDLAVVFAALPAATVVYAADDPHYTVLAVSDALLGVSGRPREALVGHALSDAFPDAGVGGLARLRASLAAAVRTGAPQHMPQQRYDLQRPDGTWEPRYWDAVNVPVRGADGVVRHVLHQTEDVTARVLGAEATERAERRAADVLARVADAYLVLDGDFRVVAANPAAERALGRPREALLGRTHWELIPGSADTEAGRAYRRVAAEGVAAHVTQHYVGDGHDAHLEIDAYPTEDGGVAIFWRDVTERARAEAALAAERERLRALILQMPTPVALHEGPELRFALVNDAFRRAGGDGRDFTGLTPREAFPELDDQGFHERLARVYATGEAWHGPETPVRFARDDRDGAPDAWFDLRYEPVRDAAGRVTGVLQLAVDVTVPVRARREVERLLAESEAARAQAEQARADAEAARAALAVSEARQRFLLALDDRLRSVADAAQVPFEAARALGERLGASRVGYAEIEADGEHSVVTRHHVDGVRGIEGRYRVADYSPALIRELRAGRVVARDDVAGDTTLTDDERAAHAALEIGAVADVPLIAGGRLVAVLFAHFRGPHAWSADELALLSDVAARTWDAVERARAEAALRASEARLRLALDVAELGTWTWDLATGAGDLDARGAEIVGLPPGSLADVATAQFASIHPDDLAPTQAAAMAGIAAGVPFNLEYRVVYPDGSVHHVASRASVLTDETGRPVRLVGTNRDVSAERQAAAERERLLADAEAARDAAEAASRAKGEFLAVMSHELRTPLNAIGGYAELMELGIHGPVTADQRGALDRIQRSQRALLSVINEVLNYARLETGAVTYDLADVPVAEVVGAAEVLVAPQLRAKGLGYAWAGCDPALTVRADRDKLQQVLLNLLSNAIKFTEARDGQPGRLEVTCATDATPDRVVIRVRDTGVGIAADKLEAVFEPFVQVDQRLTREHSGTGLGLAISRDLARGMGGDLTVESVLGQGSTFTLTLPRG